MLSVWSHLLCPAARSMSLTRYLSLFLPTTIDIPCQHDWELWLLLFRLFWRSLRNSPAWLDLYTKLMASFNLPFTYGGSVVHIKHGNSSLSCLGSMTKLIVFTLRGKIGSQDNLLAITEAMKSYYHPANNNNSSKLLQVFISCLCPYFFNNHMDRFNKEGVIIAVK